MNVKQAPAPAIRSISQAVSPRRIPGPSATHVAEVAADLFSNVSAGDHYRNLVKYRGCFTGKEVVDWLVQSGQVATRAEAVATGELLRKMGFLQHVFKKDAPAGFKDARSLYRFADGSSTHHAKPAPQQPPTKLSGIALVAHDNMKSVLLQWAQDNKHKLSGHRLFATGTTGSLISNATGLDVGLLKSGPFGGDQQIGAMIAEEKINTLIFFWDPLTAQPHDADVKALLRVAVMCNTAIAMNVVTANCLLSD